MVETTVVSAIDGAKAVVTESDSTFTFVAAWYGGTQYRIFQVSEGTWHELEAHSPSSLSNHEGEPLPREEVVESMRESLDRIVN